MFAEAFASRRKFWRFIPNPMQKRHHQLLRGYLKYLKHILKVHRRLGILRRTAVSKLVKLVIRLFQPLHMLRQFSGSGMSNIFGDPKSSCSVDRDSFN